MVKSHLSAGEKLVIQGKWEPLFIINLDEHLIIRCLVGRYSYKLYIVYRKSCTICTCHISQVDDRCMSHVN
jgi:hypothetical protein